MNNSEFWKTLTWELYGKSRLADVEISLELNGDDVQCGVDPLREQRPTELSQGHFILRWSVPDFEHVVTGLRVKGQELKAAAMKTTEKENNSVITDLLRCPKCEIVFPLLCWFTLPHNISQVDFNGPGAAQVIVIGKRVTRRKNPAWRFTLKTATALRYRNQTE